ncbi:MAG: hypothetical protein ACC707_10500 [Thiohalomonadales bacterium]
MRNKKLLSWVVFLILPIAVIGMVMTVNGGDFSHSRQHAMTDNIVTTRFSMHRIRLGGSGLSLSSPEDFKRLILSVEKPSMLPSASLGPESDVVSSEIFQYEKNGVEIKIEYLVYANDANITLQDLRSHYGADLKRLSQEIAVTYSVEDIQRSGIDGFIVEAQYPVQHLDKQLRFDVLTFVKLNQLWRVTAKYKDCDQKGQVLLRWMLESIQILA